MDDAARAALADLIAWIEPYDVVEEHDQRHTLEWIHSGADLYRIAKPDVPPQHLVAYFAVVDPGSEEMLLVDHLNAGLLLPTGGHCEPGELPWAAVVRECPEELGIPATATAWLGHKPLFLTVTETRDPHGTGRTHSDVSVWHVVQADRDCIVDFDRREFCGIHWLTPAQIQAMPLSGLDPAMHRFIAKYQHARPAGR